MGKSIRSKKDKRLRTKRRALTEKHYAKFEAANQAVLAKVKEQAKEERSEAATTAGGMEPEAPRTRRVVKKVKEADTSMDVGEGGGGDNGKKGAKGRGRKPNRAQVLVDFDNSGKRKKRSQTKGKRNHQKVKWSDALK